MDDSSLLQQALLRAGYRGFEAWARRAPPPLTVFHFTTVEALIGMVRTQSLRLSTTRQLNDKSEGEFGRDLACATLARRGGRGSALVEACAAELRPDGERGRADCEVFIASFCESHEDYALWLHYGRSGAGVAVGFDPSRLGPGRDVETPFVFGRVSYDEEDQRALVAAIVDSLLAEYESSARGAEDLPLACGILVSQLRLASYLMKPRAFAQEREWRLIRPLALEGDRSLEALDVAVDPDGSYRFHVGSDEVLVDEGPGWGIVHPRLVLRYTKAGLPLTEVVLGNSCDLRESDLVTQFIERIGRARGRAVRVRRSDIPLRP